MSEMSIGNDLIEAYMGYYENEWHADTPEDVRREGVIKTIIDSTPKQRLEVYLEWNGILGYTNRIYELATGEL